MIETICKDCGARYPLGTDHVCPKRTAKKSHAKATKASPRDDAQMASEADGVASRLSAGRTAQGAPVQTARAAIQDAEAGAAHLAPKRGRGRPKSIDDMRAYKALKAKEYRDRDKLKAQKESVK